MLFQFVVRLRQQCGDGVLGKEGGRHALAGRFGGDGLDAVLAELEGRLMFAVRPCAAGAVEAVRLVLRQQGFVIAAGDLFP